MSSSAPSLSSATSTTTSGVLSLPHLQNLIKRDPELYEEDFLQQYRQFQSHLRVFQLQPTQPHAPLQEMLLFVSQCCPCFPTHLKDFPDTLMQLLQTHSTQLDPGLRMCLCRALILLRHKQKVDPLPLLKLFFDLLKCPDKTLRQFLHDHIVQDIKGVNQARKRDHVRLNTSLQNFMFRLVQAGADPKTAKTSLDIMTELYRKHIWRDEKTVNVIATACFSDVTKIMVTAIKFFLGQDENEEGEDSDDEDVLPAVKNVTIANKVNKNSRKRQRFLENVKKAHVKKKKKDKVEAFNFSALHLIHDPQGFAEKLFKKLDTLKERFEVKLLFLDLVSRLIGTHELLLLGYYSYVSRFLQPHQRDVVSLLQFAAQAAHELVPADAVEPVVRAIVNNFVTERNSSEVMAVGLNACRELCKRCPLAIDETLLRDLAGYKTYKDKGVMMAARSLIALYRTRYPDLLHKKDRGRPTEATAENRQRQYGELDAKNFVPGAEAVNVESAEEDAEEQDDKRGKKRKRGYEEYEDEDESDSDGEWHDVIHSSDEDDDGDEDGENGEDATGEDGEKKGGGSTLMSLEEKQQKAAEVTSTRILTDADFKRIDAAQLRKQVQAYRKGSAKKGKKRKLQDDEEIKEAIGSKVGARQELVDLSSIEMIHKKRKHDKEARLATVLEGRKDHDFGSRKGKMNENASTTNKQKEKAKNFMMMKHKLKKKVKRSFVEKQKAMKKGMIRSRKFK